MRRIATLLPISVFCLVTAAWAGPTEDALRVGEEAFAKKDYGSAVTTWVNAFNERAAANTQNDETCATLLSKAGMLLSQLGRFKDSLGCYEKLLELREKLNGSDSLETQKVKPPLAAQIGNTGGDLERAENLLRESEAALAKGGDAAFDDRLLALTNLGSILLLKKDRLASHECFAKVVSLGEKHPTKMQNLVAQAYSSMAGIAQFFGRSKDQIQYQQRAAEVSAKAFGANEQPALQARVELATTLNAAGMNADAKKEFEDVLSGLEKRAPSSEEKGLHQVWATAAYRLAVVESALGNQDRVYELAKTSLKHAQTGWSELDANTLSIYLDLARLHIQRKNYAEGVKCYQRVLDIRRRELGPDHPDTKDTQRILNDLVEDVKKLQGAK